MKNLALLTVILSAASSSAFAQTEIHYPRVSYYDVFSPELGAKVDVLEHAKHLDYSLQQAMENVAQSKPDYLKYLRLYSKFSKLSSQAHSNYDLSINGNDPEKVMRAKEIAEEMDKSLEFSKQQLKVVEPYYTRNQLIVATLSDRNAIYSMAIDVVRDMECYHPEQHTNPKQYLESLRSFDLNFLLAKATACATYKPSDYEGYSQFEIAPQFTYFNQRYDTRTSTSIQKKRQTTPAKSGWNWSMWYE